MKAPLPVRIRIARDPRRWQTVTFHGHELKAFCSGRSACATIVICRYAHRLVTIGITRHDKFQLKNPSAARHLRIRPPLTLLRHARKSTETRIRPAFEPGADQQHPSKAGRILVSVDFLAWRS